jgi:glutamine transport system substrate-binding protein
MRNLQSGRCDVVVYDAPTLGTLKDRTPDRYGPFVGVIRTGGEDGISLPKGSPLLGPVNKALTSLLSDGSVDGPARQWLTFDPAKARALG